MKTPHEWTASNLGHGERQCVHCLATNREIAVVGDPDHCPEALAKAPEVDALIREAEARGMERAAEMMRKPGDIWRTCTTTGGPSNDGQKWVHMSDFNELLRRADAIRTAAATHREGK